jgi:hypothetical protein
VFSTSSRLIKPLIVKNHYSHKFPANPWYCFGVYRKGHLIGGLVYGEPVKAGLHESISPLLNHGDLMELLRLWIEDGPNLFNIESWAIGQTRKLLKGNRDHVGVAPQVKILVSYSDPYEDHLGTIYQSSGWYYQNTWKAKASKSFSVSFNKSPREDHNDWVHSRTLSRRFGTSNPKRLAKMCGHPIMVKPDSHKHRYLYFLCGSTETKRLRKSLYVPAAKDFPKTSIESPQIQVVTE